jgi:ribosomal protein S18 acetylase RimI-like enzyme
MTAVRSLGFRTDLMLRRMVGAAIEEREFGRVVRTVANPTFYWGNFLLFPALPRAGQPVEWRQHFATEFPDAEHVAIGVDGVDGELGAAAEMRALGLHDEVSSVLIATDLTPIGEVEAGAEVRPPRTAQEWAQTVEFRVAVDEDHGAAHRQFVERRAAEFRDLMAGGHGVYVAAFVDGVARAGLGVFAADGLARYQSVETHPEFRRRGLASALLVEAARLVSSQQRVDRFVIVADPSYVAIDIYRRLGFTDAEQQVQWLRPPSVSG